jgi:hypothetical protein
MASGPGRPLSRGGDVRDIISVAIIVADIRREHVDARRSVVGHGDSAAAIGSTIHGR